VFSFVLIDDNGQKLPVEYRGMKPGNFESAPSASVEGTYEEGRFLAQRVSTQCPSKYESEDTNYISNE
jgi:cytochrome c-type biogenesis protein CcmE